MTRVRTHHEFVQRPCWDRLGADAFLLHHAALGYVNAHHTDGLVPKSKAKTLHSAVRAPVKQIRGLLDAEVWIEHDSDHYRVCDVQDDLRLAGGRGDEQPSAFYIEKEIERTRVKKETWKAKQGLTQGRNRGRNPVLTHLQDRAGRDRAVQDPEGSSPAPKPLALDEDCAHGVDVHASCRECRGSSSLRAAT